MNKIGETQTEITILLGLQRDFATQNVIGSSLVNETDIFVTVNVIGAEISSSDEYFQLTLENIVVFSACAIVGILILIAVTLRIVMPILRRKFSHEEGDTEDRYFNTNDHSSHTFHPSNSSYSESSSSRASSSHLDWSDSLSNHTRSTYVTIESKRLFRPRSSPSSKCHFYGSTLSLPNLPVTTERHYKDHTSLSSKSKDLSSCTSQKTLEPAKFDDAYRSRWDNEFEPYRISYSDSLSSLSHPSEGRSDVYHTGSGNGHRCVHQRYSPTTLSTYDRHTPVKLYRQMTDHVYSQLNKS